MYGDYDIRDLQEILSADLLEAELQTSNYETRLKDIESEIVRLEKMKTKADPKQNEILELQEKRTTLAHEYQEKKAVQVQCDILQKHIEDIHAELVVKKAEYYQYSLNLFLYAVFVLNAFILGFNVSNK